MLQDLSILSSLPNRQYALAIGLLGTSSVLSCFLVNATPPPNPYPTPFPAAGFQDSTNLQILTFDLGLNVSHRSVSAQSYSFLSLSCWS